MQAAPGGVAEPSSPRSTASKVRSTPWSSGVRLSCRHLSAPTFHGAAKHLQETIDREGLLHEPGETEVGERTLTDVLPIACHEHDGHRGIELAHLRGGLGTWQPR